VLKRFVLDDVQAARVRLAVHLVNLVNDDSAVRVVIATSERKRPLLVFDPEMHDGITVVAVIGPVLSSRLIAGGRRTVTPVGATAAANFSTSRRDCSSRFRNVLSSIDIIRHPENKPPAHPPKRVNQGPEGRT
jgi:hypothetical protein